MKKHVLLYLLFFLTGTIGYTQTVTNVRARQEDKKIIVTYDLTGGDAGQTFTIKLLVSEDGGYSWKGTLTAVSGDAGPGITAGYSKQLTWDVLSEPGRDRLQGDRIAFKIRAEFSPRAVVPGGSTGNPCPGISTFTDPRDGQVYPTVQIGTQCWLKRNMNYKTGNSWCYDNKESNCDIYGRLYDWESAQRVCPSGWHLPSDAEWLKLTEFLGGENVAGAKMKEAGTAHWKSPNTGATNSSGFIALPGGRRYSTGGFYSLTYYAYFWSSSQYDAASAWNRNLSYSSEGLYRYNNLKTDGFSARCLQD